MIVLWMLLECQGGTGWGGGALWPGCQVAGVVTECYTQHKYPHFLPSTTPGSVLSGDACIVFIVMFWPVCLWKEAMMRLRCAVGVLWPGQGEDSGWGLCTGQQRDCNWVRAECPACPAWAVRRKTALAWPDTCGPGPAQVSTDAPSLLPNRKMLSAILWLRLI